MEENKPKKSFFRKWAQRLGLIFGIGASTLALGTSDAHAAALEDDREDNNIKVEEAIDHSTVAETNLQTDLDELMAKDGKITFKGGSQILADNEEFEVVDGIEQEPTGPVHFRINSIEYPEAEQNVEQVNETIEMDNVEVSQEATTVISDIEARVKALIADSKFKNLKPQNYDLANAHELVLLQQKIADAKEAGDVEKAEALAARFEKRLTSLTNFMNTNRPTPGQQITENSDGIVRLEIAINNFIQYNDPDKLDDAERENYYSILGRLMDAYNDAKYKNTVLAEQALENLGNPGYELEHPNYFNDYPDRYEETELTDTTVEIDETEIADTTVEVDEAEAANYSGLIDDRNEVVNEVVEEFKTTEVEFEETKIEEVAEEPQTTGGLIDDRQEVAEIENVDFVDAQDITFDNVEIQDKPTVFKTRVLEDDEPVVTSRIINEEKLHDVSVGQMGDFDIEEEEVPQEIHSGKIDFEKISEGVDQMGMWSEIEDVLDEEIEKLEAKNKNKNKSSKAVEVDDDFER